MHEVLPDTLRGYVAAVPSPLRVGSAAAGGRLHILEALGRGGMGVVYRAFDDVRQCPVALKTMNRVDPGGIYTLKNEFRALADVHHPNLVRLFELFREEDQWFFTMELVNGERFDRWVRPDGELDLQRLRRTFAQLVAAIDALHALGKLHRDIKPSNVLVTPEGHVVVLDFGLVTDTHARALGETVTDGSVVGTPAYLAPEQTMGGRATTATDLYAIGVMLFEVLTGQLPFSGTSVEVLVAKQESMPTWPKARVDSAPEELVALCDQLLARDPSERPDAAALKRHFGGVPSQPPSASAARSAPPLVAADLIGREPVLERLRGAYAASVAGRAVVVAVSGESGIGKTAVCSAFLDELDRQGHAVVLRGRCNERESVPFKALDALVDSLSRHLRRIRPEQAAAVMPRDAAVLTTLFPVLARVDVLAGAPVRPVGDSLEQLRRAFEAFHELLSRMRDRTPLVLYIDDLQWTDRDSTQLLRHSLLHASQLPVLIVLSHRSQSNALVDFVLDAASSNPAVDLQSIVLEPLSPAAACSLARRWLGQKPELAERIEQDARGNPFLIGEFARFAAESAGVDDAALSFHGAIDARVASTPPAARKVLALLALAGQPTLSELLLRATAASHADLDVLQNAHLVSTSRARGASRVEFYHDRIRESVLQSIPAAEARELYAALARECRGRADIEPEMLCAYLEGAGDVAAAAECAASAADQAAATLAFDHAARLYDKALELGAYSRDEGLRLARCLAEALANAGRSAESAEAYQRASLLAHGDANLDLRRSAAEQLLSAGHAVEGLAALEAVCDDVGLELPDKARLAPLRLAYELGKLRVSTWSRAPRRAVDAPSVLRLDVLQTAVVGLQCYSQGSSARLALDYLSEAQRHGDSRHMVWALGCLGMLRSSSSLYPEILAQMDTISRRDGRPELRGLLYGLRGFVACRGERHGEARVWFARALSSYAECTGMQWQMDLVRIYDQHSAAVSGDFPELVRTTPQLADEAFQRGRAWTGAMLSGFWGMPAWLTTDDAPAFRRQIERARQQWTRHAGALTLDRASYGLHRAEVMTSIYEHDARVGHALLARTANRPMKPRHRRDHEFLRGLCCVAALGGARAGRIRVADVSALRAEARACVRLAHQGGTEPYAHVVEAALALDTGHVDAAERALRAAVRLFEGSGAQIRAAAARRRLGRLIAGDEGRALVAAAETFMRAREVKNLDAMNELMCPGCE